MALVVIGRWRPGPGTTAEELEIPGPGLYEADFSVPAWLVPDFQTTRSFTFPLRGAKVKHIESRVKGDILTVRFSVEDSPAPHDPQVSVLLALTAANVLRGVAAVILGSLAVHLVQAIVDAIREVRKLGETPAGIGLAALGIAGAALMLGFRKGA